MKVLYKIPTQKAAEYIIKHLHPDLDGAIVKAKLVDDEIVIA